MFAVATGIVAAQEGPFAVMPFVQGIAQPDTPGKVMVLLLTFTGMALGPLLAAGALHGRGPVSLLGRQGCGYRALLRRWQPCL